MIEALEHYERALELESERIDVHANLGTSFAEAHATLGAAFSMLDRPVRAAVHLYKALSIDPGYAPAYGHLGNAHAEAGRLHEARTAFERGVALDPRNGWLARRWAESHRVAAGEPAFDAMERLAADAGSLPEEDRVQLHFGLAKAYDDLERFDRAFEHLRAGNAAKRASIGYDEPETLALFERVAGAFTSQFFERVRGSGDPSALPAFVIGMPRSGTTLVEAILAAHSTVFGAGEVHDLKRTVDLALGDRAAVAFDAPGEVLTPQVVRDLGRRYVRRIAALAPSSQRITNKMPVNVLYAGFIHAALPNARIVFVRRDPLDTCFSCYARLFSAHQPFAYDLAELGRYHRAYDALIEHWLAVLPPEVAFELRYEELVADVGGNSKALLAHAGLEWEDACARYWEAERRVRTASAEAVRQPVYASSVGRAHRYGAHLEPLRRALAAG